MKKLYISPKAIYVHIATENLIATSMGISEQEVNSGWTQKQHHDSFWSNWTDED